MSLRVNPSFDTFQSAYADGRGQILWARLINDIDTPVSAFLKLAKTKPYGFLLESVQGGEQRGRYSVLGFAPDLIFRTQAEVCEIARGQSAVNEGDFQYLTLPPLEALRAVLSETKLDIPQDLPPMAAGLFGYIGYDMIRHVEHLPNVNVDVLGTPDTVLTRPTIIAIFDQIAQEILLCTTIRPCKDVDSKYAYSAAQETLETIAAELESERIAFRAQGLEDMPVNPVSNVSEVEFCKSVEKAKEYIRAGDIFQVVIGQRFEAPLQTSPFSLYRSLRRLNPSPFLYYLNFADHAVVGSSPEILVRLRDGVVTVRPIAGTRPRGKTPLEDKQMELDLLADKKELAEHLMLLDLGRNDIGRVAKPGTVHVTEDYTIERYSHVMHIVSNVEGEIQDNLDVIDALFAGFPAGTVSGAPKVRAMEIIDEFETEKRGIYAGAVGYISANGDMDTAIALRTAIVKDGTMHVRAGAGIVLDSDPKSEFEETRAKAAALFTAAQQAHRFERN